MRHKAVEAFARAFQILRMHFEPRIDVGADQPGPNRSLVIGSVAGTKIAIVCRFVIFVIFGQSAKTDRSKEFLAGYFNHPFPARRVQDGMLE